MPKTRDPIPTPSRRPMPGRRCTLTLGLLLAGSLLYATTPAVAAGTLGLCDAGDETRSRVLHEFPAGIPHDVPFDTTEGCPNWRWLAIQADPDDECPRPAGARGETWRVEPLFGAPKDRLPDALKPYCLYTAEVTDPEILAELNGNLEALLEGGVLLRGESGCAAVAPMAVRDPKQVDPSWQILEDHFFDHAQPLGEVYRETLHQATPEEAAELLQEKVPSCGPRVRLAVIDTQPAGLQGPANSDHGLALLHIARRLVCQDWQPDAEPGRCNARVTAELGLPIVDFAWNEFHEFDAETGGFFGTVDQLATAVWAAIEDWQASEQRRLVLNLSVGWAGEQWGGLEAEPSRMPLGVQALYRSLETASCLDVLTVAASGNKVGGPEIEDGPLLPGGWERRPAPGPDRCREVLGSFEPKPKAVRSCSDDGSGSPAAGPLPTQESDDSWAPGLRPLVYAAGGIHADNVPLVNARSRSEPRRVAFADHALVHGARKDDWPSVLTGSSVSSVVVASAAAAVWHHRPELTPGELMHYVDESGTTLHRSAAVYLGDHSGDHSGDSDPGGRAPYVKRIAVCQAVDHVLSQTCDPWSLGCPKVDCPNRRPDVSRLAALPMGCATIPATMADDVSGHDTASTQNFCERLTLMSPDQAGPDDTPCPFRQFYGVCARPWGCPQPGGDPCLTCGVQPPPDQGTSGSTLVSMDPRQPALRLHFDPGWGGGEILAATLGIGGTRYTLDLDQDPDAAGVQPPACALVTGLDAALFARGKDGQLPTAALYFHTEKGSVESPVFFNR